MIKFLDAAVVFEEIPDEVTLAIEITNCPGHCVGCHSPWLREDIGEELTPGKLTELIDANRGITCVVFMGEGKDKDSLLWLAMVVRQKGLKTAIYSGSKSLDRDYDMFFDYIKVGPYIEEFGPLNKKTTNQRLYEVKCNCAYNDIECQRIDITDKFWRK